jgi:hypothetical protein
LDNSDGEKSKPAEHCAGGSLPRSCSSLLIRFSAMLHNLTILKQQQNFINTRVADPDPGSGAFLTLGSRTGMVKKINQHNQKFFRRTALPLEPVYDFVF